MRIGRRSAIKAAGLFAGALATTTYGIPAERRPPDAAAEPTGEPIGGDGGLVQLNGRAAGPPAFGPHGRPNADGRADQPSHDVYVVCHRHADTNERQYAAVVETLRVAADYHSSWRAFDLAVLDRGADLPATEPAFDSDAIYEYMRGNVGRYDTARDVHLLVFDNPWNRVGRGCGTVGWDRGLEPWSVAVEAAGFARLQSVAYLRAMALHEVGHTLVRRRGDGTPVDAHEAGGTVLVDGRINEIYPMSNTYVFDANGACDVHEVACKERSDAPAEFVGCRANATGEGFATPFYRNLFWSNRRTHRGTNCAVPEPDPDDASPGFTEDEIALTVERNLR